MNGLCNPILRNVACRHGDQKAVIRKAVIVVLTLGPVGTV